MQFFEIHVGLGQVAELEADAAGLEQRALGVGLLGEDAFVDFARVLELAGLLQGVALVEALLVFGDFCVGEVFGGGGLGGLEGLLDFDDVRRVGGGGVGVLGGGGREGENGARGQNRTYTTYRTYGTVDASLSYKSHLSHKSHVFPEAAK